MSFSMAEASTATPVEPIIFPWVEPLWDQLSTERPRNAHAMMFIGSKGLGKTSCALAYARHLLIGNSENRGQAETLFDAGTHPDIHVLIPEERIMEEGGLIDAYAQRYKEPRTGKNPRTVITIDQIRKLTEAITTFAHTAGMKIILILEADLLNRNAANALLKSLEEPSSNTLFLLVTGQPEKTPMTIRSRCTMVPFRVPEKKLALDWLADQPGMNEGYETFLSMAGGSPLLALEMQQSGYIDLQIRIFKSVAALWNRKTSVAEVARAWSGEESQDVLLTLQKLLADLARFCLSEQPANLYYPAQSEWLQRTAKQINLARIMHTFDKASLTRRLLRGPSDTALMMEDTAIAVAGMVD
jgi:DNA polymerase-3 subunit delta'